jgi:hypothetical protein
MEFKFIGSKYQSTKHLDVKELAVLVRNDIKEAIQSNQLPNGKYSVRIKRYSGGRSIDVTISDLEFPIIDREGYLASKLNSDPRVSRYTKIARLTLKVVDLILNQYNFDDSDSMTDYFHVRFYGDAKFDWKYEATETDAINKDTR